jgi:hypothetical protein
MNMLPKSLSEQILWGGEDGGVGGWVEGGGGGRGGVQWDVVLSGDDHGWCVATHEGANVLLTCS